ncbi:acyl carrier protein [Streptomyces eurocidicus]|uniref:Acyl carrier protein n=1 Tax=Streptomyces eurocidicus TaxID=66423 RepID=A0A2N8NTV9_STREU|nr:acyl carrier protein [Streptomyces eurocidicus]MBB5119356.1 acyl carrier protein [Streptomyces eurocidicus]MBF6053064.1 acyl carrier protein [Streptomyces eurocidicus]PNE32184.1 acyl carrier protein [Streptomyces eurocidicus]
MTSPLDQSALPENFVSLLTDHLRIPVPPDGLSAATTLESLDIDSLALMELMVAAEEVFGVVLPDDALDLTPSTTLGEAAKVFDEAT